MQKEFIDISDIDQLITQELEKVDFSTEEILRLVDIRERQCVSTAFSCLASASRDLYCTLVSARQSKVDYDQ